MADDKVRLCPHCKLCFRSDPKQHIDPHEVCPRCGRKLVEEDEDNG